MLKWAGVWPTYVGNGLPAYFKNLSPSKVNGFLDWRSMWFLTTVPKKRLPDSPEMKRGNAVENGITSFLTGNLSLDDAKSHAMKIYSAETADLDVDDVAECGAPIPDLVDKGIEALKPYGKLVSIQRAVRGKISDTILDWSGYADIEFENGVVVDLKVTGRTPSEMSFAHRRQGAFYQTFIPGCRRVDFVYLVPLKKGPNCVVHQVSDAEKHIHDLRQGALAMHRLLSISDRPEDLIPYFHPAPGDWWLKDPMAMHIASEVWGISNFIQTKEDSI